MSAVAVLAPTSSSRLHRFPVRTAMIRIALARPACSGWWL